MALRHLATTALRANAPTRMAARAFSTPTTFTAESGDILGSVDKGFKKDRVDKVANPDYREYTYLLLGGGDFIYASAVRLGVIQFVSSMSASRDVLAMASAEFNISEIDVGQTLTVKWRGKPVFIKHRSEEQIATEASVKLSELRDQETDDVRVQNPEWLVVMAICTHLGCVPISNAGEYGGWFCPCHGSHYDGSGRIRKGPAPLNLEVPPYKFASDDVIVIG